MTSDLELDLVGIALYVSGYIGPRVSMPIHSSALDIEDLLWERLTLGIFAPADFDELLDI